jgi:hypothetical protein
MSWRWTDVVAEFESSVFGNDTNFATASEVRAMKSDPRERYLHDVVERFRLNELPEHQACVVEARIAKDQHLQWRLDTLRRSDNQIFASYPQERCVQTIPKCCRSADFQSRVTVDWLQCTSTRTSQ